MTSGELLRVLQAMVELHGADLPVFLATVHDSRMYYNVLTGVDPPEVVGDGITLVADRIPMKYGV